MDSSDSDHGSSNTELARSTINKLALAREVLAKGSWHLNSVRVETGIQYDVLSEGQLTFLEVKGLSPHGPHPLSFDYQRVLQSCLPRRVRAENFFSHLIELLMTEWAICEGERYLEAFLHELNTNLVREWHAFQKGRPTPISVTDLRERSEFTVSEPGLRAKWFIDACIIWIEALWDKLLGAFLCDQYFGWGALGNFDDRMKMLGERPQKEGLVNQTQLDFLVTLVQIAAPTAKGKRDSLRDYRDWLLHLVGPRVKGAFEHPNTTQWIAEREQYIKREHNRVREAMICAFGVIVADGPRD